MRHVVTKYLIGWAQTQNQSCDRLYEEKNFVADFYRPKFQFSSWLTACGKIESGVPAMARDMTGP